MIKSVINGLGLLAELSKVRITFAVMLTTLAGYLIAKGTFDTGILLPALGIFVLACGSSALNHYQDSDRDRLMRRTAQRPIPSGRISRNAVLAVSIVLSLAGSLMLYLGSGFEAMQLGLLALLWYNGIYTPMKRRSAFAVIPGSVIGAIPPVVGWVAGGGPLFDPRALMLAFFFFIWQVPHFWLLMLKYGDEYVKAGYPSITQRYNEQQIKILTFIWVIATAISALLLPLYGLVHSRFTVLAITVGAVWITVVFAGLLLRSERAINPFYYFMRINYFVLLMIVALSVDPFMP
ncbi:MAG TPA: protoheme IX farnesyltransferase [Bacteroidales bacterium]|nr:protoheme IX farnesyltransferase [Bacteroidales bacterium]